jgi:hypothetical protein
LFVHLIIVTIILIKYDNELRIGLNPKFKFRIWKWKWKKKKILHNIKYTYIYI